MKGNVIGIDPGKHGGIVVIDDDNKIIYAKDFSSSHEIIAERLIYVSKYSLNIFLESAISMKTNIKITNQLFFINGYITGFAESLLFEVIHCNPCHWKKVMKVTSDKQTSINLALSLFPNFEEVMYAHGSYKDGIAEAALIAYYGKNLNHIFPETEQKPKKHRSKQKQIIIDLDKI